MASKIFISFRFNDGHEYRNRLCEKFDELDYTINKAENVDRGDKSESTIQRYLYEQLQDTSLTIVVLTPDALNYRKDYFGKIDDWMYDELRYSLEDRSSNRLNGVIAVYTDDIRNSLYSSGISKCNCGEIHNTINDFDNLARKNMFNVKSTYKHRKCGAYDPLQDHYISLVSFQEFYNNPKKYIDNALEKRNRSSEFNLVKRI